jgi:hypothetical protein
MKTKCPHCKKEFELPRLKCKRCGHEWARRGDELPRVCPNPECKSPYWDRERVRVLKSSKKKVK